MPEAEPSIAQLQAQVDHLQQQLAQAHFAALMERQAKETLARHERHYRTLITNLQDVVYTIDLQGVITWVNPAVEAVLGWPPAQIIGREMSAVIHAEDLPLAVHTLQQCLAGKPITAIETRLRTPGGEYRLLELYASIDRQGGEIVGILGTARDVTARRQAEQALHVQNRQLEQLLTIARSLTSTLELDQVLRRIAAEARAMLAAVGCCIYRLEPDERTLTPLAAVEPPYEAEIMATPLDVFHSFTGQAVLAGKGLMFNDAAQDERGTDIPGTSHVDDEAVLAVPLAYDGRIRGAMCLSRHTMPFTATDLTVAETLAVHAAIAIRNADLYQGLQHQVEAADQARQALAHSEGLYRALFEQASDAILLEDESLHIIDANPRACELLGYNREELLATSLADILPAGARIQSIKEIGADPRHPFDGVNRHRDGHEIPVEVSLAEVPDSSPRLVFAIVRDITARKRAVAEMRQRARQLEALHAIDLELAEQLDLDVLLGSVARRVSDLFAADMGGLYLYNPEAEQLEWVTRTSHGALPLPLAVRPKEGLVGRVWAQQRPIWVGRYSEWPGRVAAPLPYSFESVVGVPVRWGEESYGVLVVHARAADVFAAADAELLTLFAMQVAVAMHNARLFEQARGQSQLLSRTLTASERLHHGLELPDVLQRTAEGIASLGYRRVAVNLREADPDRLVTQAVAGVTAEEAAQLEQAVYAWGEFEALMADRWRISRSYLVRRTQEEWRQQFSGPVVFAPIENRGPAAWTAEDMLLLPLYGSDQHIIGVISVDDPHDGRLPDLATIQILETFANQASLAAENSRLYAHVRAELAERRRAELALRDSEEQYRALVEGAHQPIATLSREGRVLFANSQLGELTGRRAEDLLGKTVSELAPAELAAEIMGFIRQIVHSGQTCGIDHSFHLRGNVRWFEARGHPMHGASGEIAGVVIIAMDVTEQHVLEERLREAHKLEAIGRLAGGVAHEFNNLLTIINGYCEILLYGENEAARPWQAEIDEIHRAGRRAAGITRQLLAFSRRQILNMQVIDLNNVLAGMGRMLRHIIGEDVILAIDTASGLGSIRADTGQLEQIIINLAANARDAMPQGGTLTLATANAELAQEQLDDTLGIPPGHYVRLTVRDDGLGMTPETLQHLFEPFFTTKDVGEGTGLGLATVYGIIRQLGGGVRVHSAQGVGTTFDIFFPRVLAQAEWSEQLIRPELAAGKAAILVVEDDEGVRRIAISMLSRLGYTVYEAASATLALGLLERPPAAIDLILTDVVMPQMNGREFARALRDRGVDLPILYMSGYAEEALDSQGVLEAGTPLVHKPFDLEQLSRQIEQALTRSL